MCFAGWPVIVNVSVDVGRDRADREARDRAEAGTERRVADAERDRNVELGSEAVVGQEEEAGGAADVEDVRVPDVEVEVRDHDLDHARAVRPRRLLERDVCADRQAERSDRDVAFRVE